MNAAVGGGVALGDGGRDEADQPGELVRRARRRGWRGCGCSRIGCYGVGRGFWRADAGGGLWLRGGIGDVFGDDCGEAVDHAGEAGVDEGDKPGGEPDLVAALADIGPEAADDGGEAVGQRGERRFVCHTSISAWGVGGEKDEKGQGRGGRTAFLKKSSKKLLLVGLRALSRARDQSQKVFWFFFSKKNTFFLPSRGPPLRIPH